MLSGEVLKNSFYYQRYFCKKGVNESEETKEYY